MARIKEYGLDTTIDPADKVIGTDGTIGADLNKTKNFTVAALKSYILEDTSEKGWARYDGTFSFLSDSYYAVSDGNSVKPEVLLATNKNSFDPYVGAPSYAFEFNENDKYGTFVVTVVFKASAANTNSTHINLDFLSGFTAYERLSKSLAFYKGNDEIQNFHEVFQFYVDDDLIEYGLMPTFNAVGGDIKLSDVIYFIQKVQTF